MQLNALVGQEKVIDLYFLMFPGVTSTSLSWLQCTQ